jgi:DNA-binding Lrp family transcriptional regulator
VDADRTNVELARLVGLSPAATLNRVRRLKESGVIRKVAARLDTAAAGFPLQVYVSVTLARHEPRASRGFEEAVRTMPQIISADYVAGGPSTARLSESRSALRSVRADWTRLPHLARAPDETSVRVMTWAPQRRAQRFFELVNECRAGQQPANQPYRSYVQRR